MIKVELKKQIPGNGSLGLYVTGHAGAGEPGEDIVCAAVSILVNVFAELMSQEDYAMANKIRLDPGDAEILWSQWTVAGAVAYDFFVTGINKLCEQFPQFVQASWREQHE